MLWTTGAVLPVARIAELAHARGALVVVDGAQAAGAIPFRFDELGADLYAVAGAEVAARARRGWARSSSTRPRSSAWRPALGGFFSFERVDSTGDAIWWDDARRFEATGFHRPSVVGMARSIGWLSMYVGLDFVHRRGMATAAARPRAAWRPSTA